MTTARSDTPIDIVAELCTLPVVCLQTANFGLTVGDVIKNKNIVIGVYVSVLVVHQSRFSEFRIILTHCSLLYRYISYVDKFYERSVDDSLHTMPCGIGYPKSLRYYFEQA